MRPEPFARNGVSPSLGTKAAIRTPPSMRTLPVATYRIQLRQGFDFDRVTALLPYLADLGVSHVYLSPCLRAAPGSTHGYDVVDPNRVDEGLGGDVARQRFLIALKQYGLGHLPDIVPNHMSVASDENVWWADVLENGPGSRYANFFDVDWAGPPDTSKVLLPILNEHYGRALEARQLSVERHGGRFTLHLSGRRLPLWPPSLRPVLDAAARGTDSAELEFLSEALGQLALQDDPERRSRHQRVITDQLEALLRRDGDLASAVDRALASLNADADALDSVLSSQHFRIAHHRVARYELDYRRFFDIQDLAALRVHEASVFRASHELLLAWLERGEVDAVRVDHPDGLRDPAGYFRQLRAARPDLWILAEKILAPDELLPEAWAVDGTTGYDYLNVVGGLFVQRAAEPHFDRLYEEFAGDAASRSFAAQVFEAKLQVLDELLASDLGRLARSFQRVCASRRRHRDFAEPELRRALRVVLASFPVYRNYASPDGAGDTRPVLRAVRRAREEDAELDPELLDFLAELLCGKCRSDLEWAFVARFQQLCSAVTAKGVEDTAFYRALRLVCLNEVGGDPARFGVEIAEFHAFCDTLQRRWPQTLVATTTHDTKRSEDARLVLAALSEFPSEWQAAIAGWSEQSRAYRPASVDRATEYLFWQSWLCVHPATPERLAGYMEKAVREAKQRTSWQKPNSSYEADVQRFVHGALADAALGQSLAEFAERLLPVARRSSLSQTLLKLTAVGVPDIYQGSELWDQRLTDPDNRGPVDFDARQALLFNVRELLLDAIDVDSADGSAKLWLIRRLLKFRAKNPQYWADSAQYEGLAARGPLAESVIAFARGAGLVGVAPRGFRAILEQGWRDTTLPLPEGRYRNLLEPNRVFEAHAELSLLCRNFPVALLVREEP